MRTIPFLQKSTRPAQAELDEALFENAYRGFVKLSLSGTESCSGGAGLE